MIVSVTEVSSFKRCRRQWNYGSFNGQALTPIIQPKPYLDLGTMVHQSLAYWTANPTNDKGQIANLKQIFTAVAIQHKRATVARYVEAVGHEPADELLDPLLEAIVLGSSMMENYQNYYGQPLPDRLKYCSPEQEIIIPIPDTWHACPACEGTGCKLLETGGFTNIKCAACNGEGRVQHYLKARLDALAIDSHDNVYVIERKTYDKRPNLSLLEHTDQFIGYLWLAQQLAIGNVIGIAYDGLWKRERPPKKLELADLFCRTIITPAQDEVIEYGIELARAVQDMANNPYIYKNRVWQGCWDCSFEQLCAAQSSNDDVQSIIQLQYTRRTEDDVSDIAQVVEAASY